MKAPAVAPLFAPMSALMHPSGCVGLLRRRVALLGLLLATALTGCANLLPRATPTQAPSPIAPPRAPQGFDTPAQTPTPSARNANAVWQGRIALQSLAPAYSGEAAATPSTPSSFSAAFELEGSPQQGVLKLFSPLGNELRRLQWDATGARLFTPGSGASTPATQTNSLPALLHQTLGMELPLIALFDWLQGRATAAQGWTVDLSHHEQGRILAQCQQPEPGWQLKVVLDMAQ